MRGKSLIKDVSVNELLALREQGLTNAEIAKKMDVHYTSVHRLIGPQPDGLRKKPERKVKPLPPVGDQSLPEMPRKSFAERLEESYGKYCEDNGLTNSLETANKFTMIKSDTPPEPVVKIVDVPLCVNTADLARMSHMQELEKTKASNGHTHIHELIAVFGEQAVTTWLKVRLYDMGIPDCRPMNRQKMLEMLKIMNAGGANT